MLAVLSRVQAFLPQMEASNTILAQRVQADPKSVDIENVEDGMGQYIEMVRLFLTHSNAKPTHVPIESWPRHL